MARAPNPQLGWERKQTIGDRVVDAGIRVLLGAIKLLPYATRVRFCGWFIERIFAPLAGHQARSRENLAMIFPDMDAAERRRIARASANNVGRTLIENYSLPGLKGQVARSVATGEGLGVLARAHAEGRPVILATGHFGNYEAPRIHLRSLGYEVGGIYRPMNNASFNDHYVKNMQAIGGPVVPRGVGGTRALMKAVKSGTFMVMLFDQYMREGIWLDFLGRPSLTMVGPAEIALKYGAELVPFYGIRRDDGLTFEMVFESPVPPSDAETMSAELNDRLSAQIRARPEQWFWFHRRWKVRRQRSRRTASTGPAPSS